MSIKSLLGEIGTLLNRMVKMRKGMGPLMILSELHDTEV